MTGEGHEPDITDDREPELPAPTYPETPLSQEF